MLMSGMRTEMAASEGGWDIRGCSGGWGMGRESEMAVEGYWQQAEGG
jgi:hypothetical protein